MPSHTPALRHQGTRASARGASGRSMASWAVPASLAVVYMLYTVFLAGNNGYTGGQGWLMGFISAIVVFALCYAIGQLQHRVQPETASALYAVVFGCAMGWLLSLSGQTWLKAGFLGLALAISMGVAIFYVDHSHRRAV